MWAFLAILQFVWFKRNACILKGASAPKSWFGGLLMATSREELLWMGKMIK